MTTSALQAQTSLTVKQAAALMNVSERSVYRAREVLATGRDDLFAKVLAGELSVLAALKIAKPEKYDRASIDPDKDRYAALVKAWNACTDDQRAAFVTQVLPSLSR
jgi:hypothetical protein